MENKNSNNKNGLSRLSEEEKEKIAERALRQHLKLGDREKVGGPEIGLKEKDIMEILQGILRRGGFPLRNVRESDLRKIEIVRKLPGERVWFWLKLPSDNMVDQHYLFELDTKKGTIIEIDDIEQHESQSIETYTKERFYLDYSFWVIIGLILLLIYVTIAFISDPEFVLKEYLVSTGVCIVIILFLWIVNWPASFIGLLRKLFGFREGKESHHG